VTLEWLKIIAGQGPMPSGKAEQNALINFAEAHHVIGQMAVAWDGRLNGKLKDLLENGKRRSGFDHRMLAFEMNRLERALQGSSGKPILLKGAAYVALGSKAGQGRRVADIDILVDEQELETVEKALLYAGWAFDETTNNAYDNEYYRIHMHELPPLRHTKRRTVVDVHHRLLPRTSRINIDFQKMIEAADDIPERPFRIFTPTDRFVHAAIHSFADGSFDTPARSLLELHYLLDELSAADLEGLIEHADQLGAAMPVGTALWALSALFDDAHASLLCATKPFKPASMIVRMALKHKLENVDKASWAKLVLYLRSHYLRMPTGKLMAHLTKKMIRRFRISTKPEDPQNH